MADYLRKIKNLLALAESPNEHEARSALLMARKLMATHKIMKKDLEKEQSQEVKQLMTGITYSKRRDPWVNSLARTIAERHCCRSFQSRIKGRQTAEIAFIGLTDDITVCMEVFKYAVDCIRSNTDRYRRKFSTGAADSYGFGFVCGLEEAYSKQEEEGWGLVMVVPEEVDNIINGMQKKRNSPVRLKDTNIFAFKKGEKDGREFDTEKRLAGE